MTHERSDDFKAMTPAAAPSSETSDLPDICPPPDCERSSPELEIGVDALEADRRDEGWQAFLGRALAARKQARAEGRIR